MVRQQLELVYTLSCSREAYHFVLSRPSTDWTRPSHVTDSSLPSMLISSQTPRISSDQISRHPVSRPSWHIKLTISTDTFIHVSVVYDCFCTTVKRLKSTEATWSTTPKKFTVQSFTKKIYQTFCSTKYNLHTAHQEIMLKWWFLFHSYGMELKSLLPCCQEENIFLY